MVDLTVLRDGSAHWNVCIKHTSASQLCSSPFYDTPLPPAGDLWNWRKWTPFSFSLFCFFLPFYGKTQTFICLLLDQGQITVPNVQQETYRLLRLPVVRDLIDAWTDPQSTWSSTRLLQPGFCGWFVNKAFMWLVRLTPLLASWGSGFYFCFSALPFNLLSSRFFKKLICLEQPLIHFPYLSVVLCCSLCPILHFTLVWCLLIWKCHRLHCTDIKC